MDLIHLYPPPFPFPSGLERWIKVDLIHLYPPLNGLFAFKGPFKRQNPTKRWIEVDLIHLYPPSFPLPSGVERWIKVDLIHLYPSLIGSFAFKGPFKRQDPTRRWIEVDLIHLYPPPPLPLHIAGCMRRVQAGLGGWIKGGSDPPLSTSEWIVRV